MPADRFVAQPNAQITNEPGWFIKEQVEETATMSDLLAVVTRNRNDVEQIAEYVARKLSAAADSTAPPIAGA